MESNSGNLSCPACVERAESEAVYYVRKDHGDGFNCYYCFNNIVYLSIFYGLINIKRGD